MSALQSLLSLRVAYYVGVAAAASLVAHVCLHALALATGAAKEMASSAAVRPLRDALMLYPPLAAAGVQAALSLALARFLFGEPAVARWAAPDGVRFTTAVWAATSLHGIWLDFCVFRISWRILLQFVVGSFATACIVGACMGALL